MIEQITEHISFDRGFNKGYDVGHKKVNDDAPNEWSSASCK